MGSYRITRNIEASLVDYISSQLTADGWIGIRTELDFSEAYKGELPCIVVNSDDNPDKRLQVGSNQLSNFFVIEIRIFATSNGQRKDLRDWMKEKIMVGIPYYSYIITGGAVSEKILKGRISVLEITANRKELANLDGLAKEDKYRHLLAFRARVALT